MDSDQCVHELSRFGWRVDLNLTLLRFEAFDVTGGGNYCQQRIPREGASGRGGGCVYSSPETIDFPEVLNPKQRRALNPGIWFCSTP